MTLGWPLTSRGKVGIQMGRIDLGRRYTTPKMFHVKRFESKKERRSSSPDRRSLMMRCSSATTLARLYRSSTADVVGSQIC